MGFCLVFSGRDKIDIEFLFGGGKECFLRRIVRDVFFNFIFMWIMVEDFIVFFVSIVFGWMRSGGIFENIIRRRR